jgi:L-amino acid N-acyltransferase YncA
MLSIRDFAASDYDAVFAIDVEVQREYRGLAWDAMSLEEQSRLLTTSRNLVPIYVESGFSVVADEQGSLLGFIFALLLGNRRLVVVSIAVRRDARQRGVAKALYTTLLDKARIAGVEEVRALISVDNPPSMRLHESAGFELRQRIEAVQRLT